MSKLEKEKFIVAEISKNWDEDEKQSKTLLSVLFQGVIQRNNDRGYKLHSWKLNRLMTTHGILNETIIAVFEYGHETDGKEN